MNYKKSKSLLKKFKNNNNKKKRYQLDPPAYHQLADSVTVQPDFQGIGNVVHYWHNFNQLTQFGLIYEYFRPEAYRIIFSDVSNIEACGALATLPVNYKYETVPVTLTISEDYLQQIKGNIYTQQGARNVGRWVAFPNIQKGMCIREVCPDLGGTVAEAFLSMYVFGLFQTADSGRLTIQVRFKFWQRCMQVTPITITPKPGFTMTTNFETKTIQTREFDKEVNDNYQKEVVTLKGETRVRRGNMKTPVLK